MRMRIILSSVLTAILLTSVAARAAANSGWTVVPSPSPNAQNVLQAVNGLSNFDLWAVGVQFDTDYNEFTLAEHWDGTAWTVVPTPSPGSNSECAPLYQNDLTAVAEVSSNDAWAVGQYCEPTRNGEAAILTLAEHWDG